MHTIEGFRTLSSEKYMEMGTCSRQAKIKRNFNMILFQSFRF